MDGLEAISPVETPLGVAGHFKARQVIEFLINEFPKKEKLMIANGIATYCTVYPSEYLQTCLMNCNAGLYSVSHIQLIVNHCL